VITHSLKGGDNRDPTVPLAARILEVVESGGTEMTDIAGALCSVADLRDIIREVGHLVSKGKLIPETVAIWPRAKDERC